MADVIWQPIRKHFCEKVRDEVLLEALLVFPAEPLPDQPPRVIGRRCSAIVLCNQEDRPTCCWAGALPGHDPFGLSG